MASRVESGQKLLPAADLLEWLDATAADEVARTRLLSLSQAAHAEIRPWPEVDSAGHLQGVASAREQGARLVRNCAVSWLPGLCQTARYAQLLIPQVDPYGSIDHVAAVGSRMERQRILFQRGRRFEFLLSEHAITWSPGPGVMPAQRARLVEVADLPDVEVRVLPSRRDGSPDWGNFVLYTPDGDAPVFVATEHLLGGGDNADPRAVTLFESLWSRLWAAAAHGDDAVELIRRA